MSLVFKVYDQSKISYLYFSVFCRCVVLAIDNMCVVSENDKNLLIVRACIYFTLVSELNVDEDIKQQ